MAEDTTPETADDDSRAMTERFVSEVYGACRGYDPAVPAGDLRARLTAAVLRFHGRDENPADTDAALAQGTADAVLAELAADPGDLREQMTPTVLRWIRKIDEDRSDDADTATADEMTAELLSIRDERVVHLAAELDRLHTWAGLLELLDEHWPEDIFPATLDSEDRDPGPRIVSLLRWVERKQTEIERLTDFGMKSRERHQAEIKRLEHHLACMGQDIDRLERALRDRTNELAAANAKAEHAEEELASVRDHNTRWEREKARADRAERELKAYDTLRQRNLTRAIAAEAQVAALQRELAEAHETALREAASDCRRAITNGSYGPLAQQVADEVEKTLLRIADTPPSRPDDPEEIRRLIAETSPTSQIREVAQATTEEKTDDA